MLETSYAHSFIRVRGRSLRVHHVVAGYMVEVDGREFVQPSIAELEDEVRGVAKRTTRRARAVPAAVALLLASALALLTGCAASLTRAADGSYTVSVDGREQRLVVAGDAAAVAADARPLDQIALARSGGDARAAHEALLAAVDAVWALLAQLHAQAAVAADQAAVLRNAAAAQREATPR